MPDRDAMLAYFRIDLSKRSDRTRELIRQVVSEGPFDLDEQHEADLVRELEAQFSFTQRTGATVRADYVPWLESRRSQIDFFYWNRLKRYYLSENVLPPQVVSTLDKVTDEVLDYSGNPFEEKSWKRRGMVMGHVQSGKTTNYAALICKAADAGYKIIVLLAGITNSLRTQTQERLDETFIGRKSVFQEVAQQALTIVNYASERRFPAYGTSRDRDFSQAVATNYGVTLAALKEPIIFVIKKNKTILEHLGAWLRTQSPDQSIHDPLLLIDDEADNASINTHRDPGAVTAINERIRGILSHFSRSTYIGYTATPFANIFIDPATEHEVLEHDLFPRHFIKALDPPSNYVGSTKVFGSEGELGQSMVRHVEDHVDLIPLRHKKDLDPPHLPESLEHAICHFVLGRAVRILRKDEDKHSSMMINVSRFNDVQERIHGLVYSYLDRLRNAIHVNAGLGSRATADRTLNLLFEHFQKELGDSGADWPSVLRVLSQAVDSIRVETVNMKGGKLDYSKHRKSGLHIIAIGGLALSRGLTLEGLTVSYVLRNASASDTLMQMARWFGYRTGYEDLCRLYVPEESESHYEFITEAIEELRGEIKRMEQLGMTPEKFGLRVRHSPAAIRITAANKMKSASELTVAQDYSGSHIEGFTLCNDFGVNESNLRAAEEFLASLGSPEQTDEGQTALVWRRVAGRKVTGLLGRFRFSDSHSALGHIQGSTSLFADYIGARIDTELNEWDVAFPYVDGQPRDKDAGREVAGAIRSLRERKRGVLSSPDTFKLTRKNKAANPRDEEIGLPQPLEEDDESQVPRARRACLARQRALVLVHLLDIEKSKKQDRNIALGRIAATLSFCMPGTGVEARERTYQVNQVYRQQMLALWDEADDDEELLGRDLDD